MTTVFIKAIDEINENEKQNIINSLSDSAQERLAKKKNEALYLASLCALSLLTDAQRADLDYTDSGRPFFKTLDANISISHSKKYVVVAVSSSKSDLVGVDVEDATREKSNTSLLRFFTENERAHLKNGTSEIEIWTKKEALFKYLNNDDINFISLDTATTDKSFTTIALDQAFLTVCSKQNIEIKFIYK